MTTCSNEKLKEELIEITTGLLLGDASLQKPGQCKYYRLRFSQNEKRKHYVEFVFQKYKSGLEINSSKKPLIKKDQCSFFNYLTKKNQIPSIGFTFETRITSAFEQHAQIFYTNQGKKNLCPDLSCFDELLTPIALAYWFMDDGTWANKKALSFMLCTHAYKINEVNYLSNLLNKKFDLITKVQYNRQQPIIRISAKCFFNFKQLIYPVIKEIPSMQSKFPFSK